MTQSPKFKCFEKTGLSFLRWLSVSVFVEIRDFYKHLVEDITMASIHEADIRVQTERQVARNNIQAIDIQLEKFKEWDMQLEMDISSVKVAIKEKEDEEAHHERLNADASNAFSRVEAEFVRLNKMTQNQELLASYLPKIAMNSKQRIQKARQVLEKREDEHEKRVLAEKTELEATRKQVEVFKANQDDEESVYRSQILSLCDETAQKSHFKNELESQLSAETRLQSEFLRQLQDLEASFKAVKDALKECQEKVTESKAVVEKLNDEIGALNGNSENMKGAIASAKEAVDVRAETSKGLDETTEQLLKEVHGLEIGVKQLADIPDHLEAARREAAGLDQAMAQCQKTLDSMKNVPAEKLLAAEIRDELEIAFKIMSRKYTEVTEKQKLSGDEFNSLEREVNELQAENEALKKEMTKLNNDEERLNNQLNESKAKMGSVKASLNTVEQSLEEQSEQLDCTAAKVTEMETLEAQKLDLKSKLDAIEGSKVEQRKSIDEMHQSYLTQIKELRDEVVAKEGNLETLISEETQAKTSVQNLKSCCTEELQELQASIDARVKEAVDKALAELDQEPKSNEETKKKVSFAKTLANEEPKKPPSTTKMKPILSKRQPSGGQNVVQRTKRRLLSSIKDSFGFTSSSEDDDCFSVLGQSKVKTGSSYSTVPSVTPTNRYKIFGSKNSGPTPRSRSRFMDDSDSSDLI